MELTKVECPCGAAHEIPAELLDEVLAERDIPREKVRIACPDCARKIVLSVLPELLEHVHDRAKQLGREESQLREEEQRMAEKTEIDFDEIEHETDEAVMFEIDNRLVWLPKSQIEFDRDDKTITLPEWLATEKGLG